MGNDTRSQGNLACSSQPHVLSLSDQTNEGFEPSVFQKGPGKAGKGADRSWFRLPRHLFWELNSSQPRRPTFPCWHSSIALTRVKGGHCRLGPLTAHYRQGLARPQSPSGIGTKAGPSLLRGPLGQDGPRTYKAVSARGRGGGALTPVGRGGWGEVLPPGGAPRLGCSDGVAGRLRGEGPGPGFCSWTTSCPTQHPGPKSTPSTQVRTGAGWSVGRGGEMRRGPGLRRGCTPGCFSPGLRGIKWTRSPTLLPLPARGPRRGSGSR